MVFPILPANTLSDTGFNIDNSCRWESGENVALYYTPGENGSGAGKKFTISCWVKRAVLGGQKIMMGAGTDSGDDDDTCFRFSSDKLQLTNFAGGASTLYSTTTNAVFRDVSAWYHVVASVDTSDGTEANRVKLYVNGEYISGVTGDYPTQNFVYKWCMQHMQVVGARPNNDNPPNTTSMIQCTGGYLAEVMMVDNQQLAASSFGETDEDSGIWKPKNISGIDVGTNGFYLEFKQTGTGTAGTTTIGADTSGETNHLTSTGLAATDITTDTPTNNFCTMNPLDSYITTATEGNLQIAQSSGSYQIITSTISVPKNGKWYCEVEMDTVDSGADDHMYMGIINRDLEIQSASYDAHNNTIQWHHTASDSSNGRFVDEGTTSYNNSAIRLSSGDIVMIAVDSDNDKLWFGKAGTWYDDDGSTDGDPAGNSNETAGDIYYSKSEWTFFCGGGGGEFVWKWNFGNPPFAISSGNADDNGYGNFEYDVPTGFYALCTKNLAEYG